MDGQDFKIAVLDASRRYVDQTALRASVAAIPLLGGAIDQLLSGSGAKWQAERVEQCLNELNARLGGVEGVVQEFTEDFYDLSISAFEGVVKTKSNEKIKRFANILANKVLDEESDWDDAQMALSILSGMNDIHLKILATIQSVEPYAPNSDDTSNNGLPGKQLIFMSSESLISSESAKRSTIVKLLPEYSQVLLDVACADLSSKGFLFDEMTTLFGDGKPIYSLTKSGEWFIKWVSEYRI